MRLAIATAAIIVTHIAAAATPIDGWYSSIFGGYAYLPNNISKTHLALTRTDSSYSSGYDAGGSIGYKGHPIRYEGEVTYINANIDHFKLNGVRVTAPRGYSNAVLGMANIYYDFPEMVQAIQPYLGVGIGYGWVNTKLNSAAPFGLNRFSSSDSVFAYQALAGLTYNFAENFALTLGYRYVATERPSELGKVFQAHLGNLGVVYRFNEANYK